MKSYLGIGFSVFLSVAGNNPPKCFIHHSQSTVLSCKKTNNQVSFFYVIKPINHRKIEGEDKEEDDRDTVRVRIWRALASGEELSLKELGVATKERSRGDLRAHLRHVEKQAKTLRNKNMEWRKRRGLPTENVKIEIRFSLHSVNLMKILKTSRVRSTIKKYPRQGDNFDHD